MANIMYQDMVFRKPMTLMRMRQQHRMKSPVSIKDALLDIWECYRLCMLDLEADYIYLQMWHTGSIDIISHPDKFFHSLEIL